MSLPLLPYDVWVDGTDPEQPWNDNVLRATIMGGKDVNNATTAQPSLTSPADDYKAYIIQSTHTGAQWATFTPKSVAIFVGGGWYEFTPVEGARISITGTSYIYTSGAWTAAGGAGALRNTVSALSTSGSVAIDYALGDYFTLALAGNVSTFTFSNLPGSGKGASLMVRITQDSTPRTVGWPASFKWAGGVAGVVSTGSGAVDVLAITTFDNGTTWDATLAKAFA